MAKPIVYNMDAMSYQEENEIPFTYSGGTIKSSSIRIIEAVNNIVVYEGTQNSASTQYNLPADSINVTQYGIQYYIQIRVTELDNTKSSWSDTRFVYFITTPTFQFSNIREDAVIKQSYLNAILLYYQLEGELLQDVIYYLYDSRKNLLLTSGIVYDVINLSYNYNGFVDGIYYIRAKGETIHGYQVDTGDVRIIVDYVTPETFSNFYLYNDYQNGYIRYETNIISIDYHGDEEFEYENGYINLIDKTLIYDRGFRIDDDCIFIIKGKDMYRSGIIFFECLDTSHKYGFYITSYIYDDDRIRYKLIANNGLDNYILYSEPIEALDHEDLVDFWIKKENNIYLFKVFVTRNIIDSDNSHLLEKLYNTSNLLKFDSSGLTIVPDEEKSLKWNNVDGTIMGITNDSCLYCFLNDRQLSGYNHKVDMVSTSSDDDALVIVISAKPNGNDYDILSLICKLNNNQNHCGVNSDIQFALVSNLYRPTQIVLAKDETFNITGAWKNYQKGIGIRIIKTDTDLKIYRTPMRTENDDIQENDLDVSIALPVISTTFSNINNETNIDYTSGFIGYGNISQDYATFKNIILNETEVG